MDKIESAFVFIKFGIVFGHDKRIISMAVILLSPYGPLWIIVFCNQFLTGLNMVFVPTEYLPAE